MRDLNSKLISRFCNTIEWEKADVLWVQGQDAAILEEPLPEDIALLRNASLINLSRFSDCIIFSLKILPFSSLQE